MAKVAHRILYIEDDETFHYLVKHTLKDQTVDSCMPTITDAMPKINQNGYDAVLLDWRLRGGDMTVFEFINKIKEKTKAPVYVVSSEEKENVIENLKKNGINDVAYISKGNLFDGLNAIFP